VIYNQGRSKPLCNQYGRMGPPNLGAVKGRQIRRSIIFINVFLAFLCHLDYSSVVTKFASLIEFRFNRHDNIALFLVIVVILNLPLHSF